MSAVCFAAVLVLVWGYLAAATLAAWRFSRRLSVATGGAGSGHRPVSVLKPLCGAEPGLYENLRSFVDQDYPAVQIVLGVRDPGDDALPIARALIRDRRRRDIALVVNSRVAGSNLKVANLENMLPAARHDWIVLADSDMRVDPRLPVGRHRAARPTRNRPGDLPLQRQSRPADCGRSWRRCRSTSPSCREPWSAMRSRSATAASARRSRCAATCWTGSAALRGCATNSPTTIGWEKRCAVSGSRPSCRPISSTTG